MEILVSNIGLLHGPDVLFYCTVTNVTFTCVTNILVTFVITVTVTTRPVGHHIVMIATISITVTAVHLVYNPFITFVSWTQLYSQLQVRLKSHHIDLMFLTQQIYMNLPDIQRNSGTCEHFLPLEISKV